MQIKRIFFYYFFPRLLWFEEQEVVHESKVLLPVAYLRQYELPGIESSQSWVSKIAHTFSVMSHFKNKVGQSSSPTHAHTQSC